MLGDLPGEERGLAEEPIMKRPQRRKESNAASNVPIRLSAKLDRGLLAYVSAATSAGVAILALNCPAHARIIYTRANEEIFPSKLFPLNLNHDPGADFTFDDSHGSTSIGGAWGILTIFPNRSANEIWGYQTSRGFMRLASQPFLQELRSGGMGSFLPARESCCAPRSVGVLVRPRPQTAPAHGRMPRIAILA